MEAFDYNWDPPVVRGLSARRTKGRMAKGYEHGIEFMAAICPTVPWGVHILPSSEYEVSYSLSTLVNYRYVIVKAVGKKLVRVFHKENVHFLEPGEEKFFEVQHADPDFDVQALNNGY